MKNLTWQNPEQLFVAQELINKVKSKCCGIKVIYKTMNKKSFFWGVLTGVVLTFVGLFVIGLVNQNSEIQYLEKPVSYENKKETSFKVFQVLGNAALASEISNKEYKWYNGNTVVLLGENFYSDQVVTVRNPQRVGTYSYTNKGGMPMTVPVIEGEME